MRHVESGCLHPVSSLSHSSLWSCVLLLYFFRCVASRREKAQWCVLFVAVGHWGGSLLGAMADRSAACALVPVFWRTRVRFCWGRTCGRTCGVTRYEGIFSSRGHCPVVFHSGRSSSHSYLY